jgi:hypothetical protein
MHCWQYPRLALRLGDFRQLPLQGANKVTRLLQFNAVQNRLIAVQYLCFVCLKS